MSSHWGLAFDFINFRGTHSVYSRVPGIIYLPILAPVRKDSMRHRKEIYMKRLKMDNDETLLIKELYPFDRFKKCWLPKVVFQMQIWDVPSSLDHLGKYISPGLVSLHCPSWVEKSRRRPSQAGGSQSCRYGREMLSLAVLAAACAWGWWWTWSGMLIAARVMQGALCKRQYHLLIEQDSRGFYIVFSNSDCL